MTDMQHSHRDLRLRKSVVLVGMMGCGKTSVGRALANMLRAPFLDSDHEIEMAANATIAEIFARDGERFFRDREAEVLARLLAGPPVILSTGGGAWLQQRNRDITARRGVSVWLSADIEILWNRVRHRNTRPLLQTADPKATLTDLLEQRAPVYACADLRVDAEANLSVEGMATKVVRALGQTSAVEETAP